MAAQPAKLQPTLQAPPQWREPALQPPLVPPRAMPRQLAGPLPLLLAWVGSFVLLAALAGVAVVWRAPIMQAWPPSGRLFAALGLG